MKFIDILEFLIVFVNFKWDLKILSWDWGLDTAGNEKEATRLAIRGWFGATYPSSNIKLLWPLTSNRISFQVGCSNSVRTSWTSSWNHLWPWAFFGSSGGDDEALNLNLVMRFFDSSWDNWPKLSKSYLQFDLPNLIQKRSNYWIPILTWIPNCSSQRPQFLVRWFLSLASTKIIKESSKAHQKVHEKVHQSSLTFIKHQTA